MRLTASREAEAYSPELFAFSAANAANGPASSSDSTPADRSASWPWRCAGRDRGRARANRRSPHRGRSPGRRGTACRVRRRQARIPRRRRRPGSGTKRRSNASSTRTGSGSPVATQRCSSAALTLPLARISSLSRRAPHGHRAGRASKVEARGHRRALFSVGHQVDSVAVANPVERQAVTKSSCRFVLRAAPRRWRPPCPRQSGARLRQRRSRRSRRRGRHDKC